MHWEQHSILNVEKQMLNPSFTLHQLKKKDLGYEKRKVAAFGWLSSNIDFDITLQLF